MAAKKKNAAHGGAGRGQGRKPLNTDAGVMVRVVSVRMSGAQAEKLMRLGGSEWVRKMIDSAR